MAKKLGQVTNPITAQGGNILSPTEWLSRILFVAWIGAVFAIGSKVLTAADKFVPGNNTPNAMKNATTQAVTTSTQIF